MTNELHTFFTIDRMSIELSFVFNSFMHFITNIRNPFRVFYYVESVLQLKLLCLFTTFGPAGQLSKWYLPAEYLHDEGLDTSGLDTPDINKASEVSFVIRTRVLSNWATSTFCHCFSLPPNCSLRH